MNPEGLNNSLQNIPDIKEKTMKEAREYIDRDDNCDKVGRRMNMHCKEIKQEMENMKSFSKKIAGACDKIKNNTPTSAEDESALKLYHVIKNKNIPNEDQWITWRNSLNLILIKDIDTAIQKFPSEERKEIISKGKELKRSLKEGRKNFTDNEKVLLDFYEMFEIYEAIQISEIMDKLEASVNGFLETIPTKNLNQENIEYSLFAGKFISYCEIDTILGKLSPDKKEDLIKNKIVTFINQSVEARKELLDSDGNRKSDWLIFVSLASRACSQWNPNWEHSNEISFKDKNDKDISIPKESIKVESKLPSIIITLPEKLYQYLIVNNSEGYGITTWTNSIGKSVPICFINNKEDSLKEYEKQESDAEKKGGYLINEDGISPSVALTQAINGTSLHEPQHAIDHIFGININKKEPFNEVLPRLAERQPLKGIMRDLMKVGGYDPYFKYESHKPKPKQPEDYRDTQANDKYDKELKERNTEKVMFDKSMERLKSGVLQGQLNTYLSTGKMDTELQEMAKDENINNYLIKTKETINTLKNGLRALIELDCICDKDLMKANKREGRLKKIWEKKAENFVSFDDFELNKNKELGKDIFPKCIINTLSSTPIEDWGNICIYARKYGISQCGINPCR